MRVIASTSALQRPSIYLTKRTLRKSSQIVHLLEANVSRIVLLFLEIWTIPVLAAIKPLVSPP